MRKLINKIGVMLYPIFFVKMLVGMSLFWWLAIVATVLVMSLTLIGAGSEPIEVDLKP
jgi:hypothetical protein